MSEDILSKAKALLGEKGANYVKKELPAGSESLAKVREILKTQGSLDIYLAFDTTGSMGSYINSARDNIAEITRQLLEGSSDLRISVNGVGDHCDGANCLQMYALSNKPEEVKASIENIVMTNGGDEPEAYECLALTLAKRLPLESLGRKRVVVLVGDSVPHGMNDEPCSYCPDYKSAFQALKTLCDGFYFVGCNPLAYEQQKTLIDGTRKDCEQFLELGSMVDTLPHLIVALAKKMESEKALAEYMKKLELEDKEQAGKVRGLLCYHNGH